MINSIRNSIPFKGTVRITCPYENIETRNKRQRVDISKDTAAQASLLSDSSNFQRSSNGQCSFDVDTNNIMHTLPYCLEIKNGDYHLQAYYQKDRSPNREVQQMVEGMVKHAKKQPDNNVEVNFNMLG